MRVLLLILIFIAVVLVLMGSIIAVLTWYYSRKDRSVGANEATSE